MRQKALESRGDVFPFRRSLTTPVAVGLGKTCGHLVNAQSSHNLWHQFITSLNGLLKIYPATVSSWADAAQPTCPTTGDGDDGGDVGGDGGGGDGGGGGGGGENPDPTHMICYWEKIWEGNQLISHTDLGCFLS